MIGESQVPGGARGRDGVAPSCVACGAIELEPAMRVRGEAGAEGLIPTTKQYGTALGDIVRCRSCGHMQLDRPPLGEMLGAAYAAAASEAYVEEERGQRASFRRLLERVERYSRRGRLLDVGCWTGFLLAEAGERGWQQCVGLEPSGFASSFARERLGLDVRTEELLAAELPAGHFDVVVMGDVLEHLPDTGAALKRVGELLRPGGLLALALPDAGSRVARLLGPRWWSVIPTHLHYFTRQSAATMVSRHGFAPVYVDTDPKSFTVGYYLDKGSGYLPTLSRVLVACAERLGLARRVWTPDFGDRMLLLARREPGAQSPGAR